MISVLYVDDEPGLLEIGKLFLESFGDLSVSTIGSASAALALLKKEHFDAVISDYQMPGLDGLEFLKQVRLLHGQIPFILFTGRGREEVVIRALNLGADFYLQKGGDPQPQFAELAHKVRQAVQRRRMEVSLEESESRYRAVIESQTELICRFRPDGTLLFVNGAFCTYYQKAMDDLIGRQFKSPIPPDDRARVDQHFSSLTHETPVGTIEHRILMPDGSMRWQQWSDRAIFDKDGSITEFQSVGRDITDRKLAEEAMEKSENLYRTIFNNTGAATIIIGPDTTILLANRGWEKLTGLPRADQENKLSWTVFFNKEDADRMVRYHHDRRKDPSLAPPLYESRLIDAKKVVHNCFVYVHMIPGTKNSVASLVDITERKQAEESLRESEERFRVMADNSPVAIVVYQDNRLIYVNDYTSEISGYSKEELYSKDFWDLFHAESRELVRERGLARLRGEPVPYQYEIKLITRQGETRFAYLSAGKILLGGKNAGIATIVDITDQKRSSAALVDSESRLRSFIETTQESVTLVDEEGKVIEWNPGAERISGIKKEEALGRYLWDLTFSMVSIEHNTEERRTALEQEIRTMLKTGVPVFEGPKVIEAKRPDGSRICTRQVLFPIKTEKGFRIGSITQDITDEKRAEAAIIESEGKYRELADLLPQMIFEMDLDFKITYANRHALTTLGFTEQNLRDEINAISFIEISQHAKVKENMQKSVKGIPYEPEEYTAIRKDGSRFPVTIHSAPVYRNKKLTGFRGVIVDISARKRMEDDLRESEEKYRLVVEHSNNGVFIFRDSRVLFANTRAAGLTRHSLDELREMDIWDLVHPDDRARLQESAKTRISGSTLPSNINGRIINKSGEILDCDFFITRILFQNQPALLGIIQEISEQKRVQAVLLESEEKYRAFVENTNDIIYGMDLAGRITNISPQISRYGYTPEEVISNNLVSYIMEEDLPGVFKDIETTVSTGQSTITVFRVKDKSGTIHWLEDNGTAVFDAAGNLTGLSGILRDITDRKKAEEKLRESEGKFRSLVETSPDIIWETDEQGKFRYISPMITTLMGYTPEEFIRKPITDLIPEEKRSAVMQEFARYLSPKTELMPFEVPARHRDGHDMIIEIRPSRLTAPDGTASGFRGMAVDITERKKAEEELLQINEELNASNEQLSAAEEELRSLMDALALRERALRESEERFRSIVETSPDMIWEIDQQGKFRYISPRIQVIMGFTPEELLGRPITDMMPEEAKPLGIQELERLFSPGGSLTPFEVPARHRDGHNLVLEIRPSLTGINGKREGFRGVAVDITERKRAEDALSLANRQLKLLTGITRHDILNKVAVALGFLKIAGMKFKDPALAGYLEKTESAITEIRTQIEFTKIYENIGTHEPQWIELDAAMPRAQVPATITLRTDVQGITVFTDPMLERVFFNLLDNSIRHGGRVTEIRVSSRRSGEDLIVVWEDNGVGIAAEEKEQIFERGFGKHTGLGMFLVQEILSLTGITITETGDPGSGARFEILVPKGMWRIT